MNALVLSGGSVKGAFQAGAVKAVLEKKIYPEFLYGISVGSLNSTYINHQAGLQGCPSYIDLDWDTIGKNLVSFWLDNVTQPSDLVIKRSFLKLVWGLLTGKFDGVTDTEPLRKLVRAKIKMENLWKSPLKHQVGTVNYLDGEIVFADPKFPDFLDYVIGSTAIPIAMPAMLIGETPYFDGGLREVAPLKPAIKSGADTIVAILCQPYVMGTTRYSYQNALHLLERITDIMVNQIENADIDNCLEINSHVPADGSVAVGGRYDGKKKINVIVIRPEAELMIDITSFKKKDIEEMIELGYYTAKGILEKTSL